MIKEMPERSMKILRRKRNWLLLAWPLGMAVYLSARFIPDAAEKVYAKGIFRVYALIMSHITGILPFSFAEILLILFVLFLTGVTAAGIVHIIRTKDGRLPAVCGLLRDLLCIIGIVFFWFMIGAGTNYYRYEFSRYCGLEIKKSTTEELYGLCTELAEKAGKARVEAVKESAVGAGANESFVSARSDRELAYEAKLAMEKLGLSYDVLQGWYPRPKAVFFSRFMSEFNITGVYFPWTVEANVNVDVPDYTIGVTLCHELSHLRGFMREDEANFIGYLACVNSECSELEYSGYMLALVYAGNKLYADSPELYASIYSMYTDGMRADLKEHSKYWKQFEDTVLSEVGEKMNDTYLKANNQTDGTKSYGRMVDLLLAQYRAGLE